MEWNHMIDEDTSDREKEQIEDDLRFDEERDRKAEEPYSLKEQLVTFETAKLAREKGFIHMKANCYGDNMCYQLPDGELTNALTGNTVTGYILAPTQSLLHKWLLDIHGYYVIVIPTVTADWTFKIINTLKKDSMEVPPYTDVCGEDFSTYEAALEAGLYETLKLIEL